VDAGASPGVGTFTRRLFYYNQDIIPPTPDIPTRRSPLEVLQLIAFYQNRRDEVANQELAHQLAANRDHAGISLIAASLRDENPAVRSDCIKVLYEVGYLNPVLIAPFAADFLDLLQSRENRLVWGAMIALSTIASLEPQKIAERLDLVFDSIQNGSVITADAGVRVLAGAASTCGEIQTRILPFLLHELQCCRAKSLAMRLEDMTPAFTHPADRAAAAAIAVRRQPELTPAQRQKVNRTLKKWG
jgi:hypothetical protein